MAGAWDFTATGGNGHPVAVEAILTQDTSGNISGNGTVTAQGPSGNVFEADIFGSSLSAATDIAVDYLGNTCGTDDGTRSVTGTINSSNQVTLSFNGGGSMNVSITGTLSASATPPFSGIFTVSAPGCNNNGQTGNITAVMAGSLAGNYSGVSASDNTDTISLTVTAGTNGSFTGSGTDSINGSFSVTGTAVANGFSATIAFTGSNTSAFGYFDPQLGSKGSILLTSFEGGSATSCGNGVPIDNGSCLIAILAKQ
jgi:hypothetical protein